ncbi:MAG: signal peptidase II [Alphaproteobacteria bacterium]|nr:signal peptidase II [Alphaproteobacteria bacterium]
MSARTRYFLITCALVVLLDQATKLWINNNIELWRGSITVIDGFFQIVHYRNKGAVGGVLGGSDFRLHIFFVFTLVALGAIGWMVWKLPARERFVPTMLGLIAGGAIGNAIDRAYQGEVIDFLRFYTEHPEVSAWLKAKFGTAEYPSFNVADMGIVVGVIAFFIQQFWQDRVSKEADLSADDLPPEDDGAVTA